MDGNIAQQIIPNRVVFVIILIIHRLVKTERNRVP